ncbi:DUF805 domain-containing protein [Novosphingobium sp. P6W]|uniref:DUF805 domain-containing protein n=1 Tax=Novosphingobium sp. P6W TaxID=1609758 RepID=UPI0005C2D710|nr:DUF805 domain-containing protein [Novosphingobium sp. P6W]AXB76710.1 DUF805 domain-containing protein [Novosphingobium sp. P6W]KIS33432.1 hypothetical protein TQ38_08490 [Novosphingobium sp. P6W]
MLGAIKYNLRSIARFDGRDARQTFWFYVLFLVILQYAVGMALSVPMLGGAMTEAIHGAMNGAAQAELQARIMAKMGSYMRTTMIVSSIVSMVVSLLLVASFVRRLHDSNRPGWIAGLALGLSLAARVFVWIKMDELVDATMLGAGGDMTAAMAVQSKMLAGTLLGWAAMLIVVVFGAWRSTPGPNRYGEQSVRY